MERSSCFLVFYRNQHPLNTMSDPFPRYRQNYYLFSKRSPVGNCLYVQKVKNVYQHNINFILSKHTIHKNLCSPTIIEYGALFIFLLWCLMAVILNHLHGDALPLQDNDSSRTKYFKYQGHLELFFFIQKVSLTIWLSGLCLNIIILKLLQTPIKWSNNCSHHRRSSSQRALPGSTWCTWQGWRCWTPSASSSELDWNQRVESCVNATFCSDM